VDALGAVVVTVEDAFEVAAFLAVVKQRLDRDPCATALRSSARPRS
jgi:hypothetical protein